MAKRPKDEHRWAWYHTEAFEHIMKHHPRGGHWNVYCVLCNYRRWDGVHKDQCYPSYDTIAEQAHLTRRSVRRIIRDLRGIGVVTIKYDKVVDRRNHQIGRRRNIYTLLQPSEFHDP